MISINEVQFIGNLGGDPELKELQGGAKVCNFSIATQNSYKDKAGEWINDTEWHSCKAWGRIAERIVDTYSSGDRVFVKGRVTYDKWKDKSGNNRKKMVVNVNYIGMVMKNNADQATKEPSNQQHGENEPPF